MVISNADAITDAKARIYGMLKVSVLPDRRMLDNYALVLKRLTGSERRTLYALIDALQSPEDPYTFAEWANRAAIAKQLGKLALVPQERKNLRGLGEDGLVLTTQMNLANGQNGAEKVHGVAPNVLPVLLHDRNPAALYELGDRLKAAEEEKRRIREERIASMTAEERLCYDRRGFDFETEDKYFRWDPEKRLHKWSRKSRLSRLLDKLPI